MLTVAVVHRREVSDREAVLDTVSLNHVAARVVGVGASDAVLSFVSFGETVSSVGEDVGRVAGTVDLAENRAAVVEIVERAAAARFGGAHAVGVALHRETGVACGSTLLIEGERDGIEAAVRLASQVAGGGATIWKKSPLFRLCVQFRKRFQQPFRFFQFSNDFSCAFNFIYWDRC